MIVRFFVYGFSLFLTSLVLPGFTIKPYEGKEVYSLLILAAIFGIIAAVFKPLLLFLALPFLLQTAGLVIVLVNIVLFALLDGFADRLMEVAGVGWLIVGGIFVGIFAFVLENLLGVPEPILTDVPPDAAENAS
jgi:putative membrane protein